MDRVEGPKRRACKRASPSDDVTIDVEENARRQELVQPLPLASVLDVRDPHASGHFDLGDAHSTLVVASVGMNARERLLLSGSRTTSFTSADESA